MPFQGFLHLLFGAQNSLLVVSLKTWSIVFHAVLAAKVGSKMNA